MYELRYQLKYCTWHIKYDFVSFFCYNFITNTILLRDRFPSSFCLFTRWKKAASRLRWKADRRVVGCVHGDPRVKHTMRLSRI